MPEYISLIVEDLVQEEILRKILKEYRPKIEIKAVFGLRGNRYIQKKLFNFNKAAQYNPYLVLTDLDREECPPILIEKWVNFDKHPKLIFRIAVREAESWLIADRKNFASYLGISAAKIKGYPEEIANPKEYLVNLARSSRIRRIREDIVPEGTAHVGRNYNSTLIDFIRNRWDIEAARKYSESLSGLIKSISNLP